MSNLSKVHPIRGTNEPIVESADVSPDAPGVEFRSEGTQPASVAPVYGDYFGVKEAPFNLTPDPRFLFLTSHSREALSNIRYGLAHSRGLTVLLGDAGTGKTTLVRTALAELPSETTKCVLLSNPALGRQEFYEYLAGQFGFSPRAAVSKTRFLAELENELKTRAERGGITGLIVDEAQSLPHDLLEEIRLLGNIETDNRKLLNIVLSGQPELADRLNEPELRQLKQRVALRCYLAPLTIEEAFAYVSGRIRIAGGAPEKIFTAEAVIAAHRASAGIPRSLNVICDNALLSGFASQVKPVTAKIVGEVCRDFDFTGAPKAPSVAPAPKPAPLKPPTARDESPAVAPQHKKKRFSFFS